MKQREVNNLEQELRALEVKRAEIDAKMKEIELMISEMKDGKINWTQKIMNAFNVFNRPLTTLEILLSAFPTDEHVIENPVRRKKYIAQLSLVLFRLAEKEYIFSEQIPGEKGKRYGLPQWKEQSKRRF
jgi:hypothetical protein